MAMKLGLLSAMTSILELRSNSRNHYVRLAETTTEMGELVSRQPFRATGKDKFYSVILAETRKEPAWRCVR